MKLLSIVIPVYNAEKTIVELLDNIEKVILPIDKELILVDDFSKDNTRDILKNYENKYHIIYHKQNTGKGSAVKTGIKISKGDIVLIQDSDLEYNPKDYLALLSPILDGKSDVVYGSRYIYKNHQKLLYRIANTVLTFFSNICNGLHLSDVLTGYKVFLKDILCDIDIKEQGFGIEVEITAKLAKKKAIIKEVPISYYSRTVKEGKNIKAKHAFVILWCILKYGF